LGTVRKKDFDMRTWDKPIGIRWWTSKKKRKKKKEKSAKQEYVGNDAVGEWKGDEAEGTQNLARAG